MEVGMGAPARQGREAFDVEELLRVLRAVQAGDLDARLPDEWEGAAGQAARMVNDLIAAGRHHSEELERVSRMVGKEGRFEERLSPSGIGGMWTHSVEQVNVLLEDLVRTDQIIAQVIESVARGDLSHSVPMQVDGRPLRGHFASTAGTVNTMVDQLSAFSSEVTRVAREVGTEGKLGGQAQVPGVSGVWKDLTDKVNQMAANLTGQVRNIAEVTTAVAQGDLSRKVAVDVQGEILDLKNTINVMVDQLSAFSSEVTRVAHEVGTEGKLGGQAQVPGVSGVWKDLTDNVNHLAETLTDQIRAIADVATSVTEGDLTRTIGVEAFGEVAVLKDKLNEMIRALRDTTERTTEQDWLKTHLADFNRMLQGHRDLGELARMVISELAPLVSAQQGALFTVEETGDQAPVLRLQAGYAYPQPVEHVPAVRFGEGLIGQCALEQRPFVLDQVPEGHFTIVSGLGASPPRSVVVLPVLFEGKAMAVIELASLQRFLPLHLEFLGQVTDSIGVVINTIEAHSRTERLLDQSQSLAGELQTQQAELRRLLIEAEAANRSKSAFLRMATHELRSPLATALGYLSLLRDGPYESPPVGWARPLEVLNRKLRELARIMEDVLEVSRLEADAVHPQPGPVDLLELALAAAKRAEPQLAERGARFMVDPTSSPARAYADPGHVARILDQLLDNALAYSEPECELRVRAYEEGAEAIIEVIDSGMGIDPGLSDRIFEPFVRLDDPSRSMRPGTGLGLTVGAGLAHRNGGSLVLAWSRPGEGSCIRLSLPRPDALAGGRVGSHGAGGDQVPVGQPVQDDPT